MARNSIYFMNPTFDDTIDVDEPPFSPLSIFEASATLPSTEDIPMRPFSYMHGDSPEGTSTPPRCLRMRENMAQRETRVPMCAWSTKFICIGLGILFLVFFYALLEFIPILKEKIEGFMANSTSEDGDLMTNSSIMSTTPLTPK